MAATKTRSGANGKGGPGSAKRAVESTAKDVGQTAGRAVRGARVPLLAAGVAIAGAAGGFALGSRHAHRKERLLGAAKEIGSFGAQVGHLATELQAVRENGAGRTRRSPIEVVLEGLTARRLPG